MSRHRDCRPIDATAFAEIFLDLNGLPGPILLAVSGGPDSTALLHGAATWASEQASVRLAVATVDHAIRPASRAEAEAVAARCRALGLRHQVLTWSRGSTAHVSHEAARRARYGLLVRHGQAIGASHLVTAHTRDDQAETLLIRMAAGSGLAGLVGMRPLTRRGGLLHARPFLALEKARLVATCRAEGWSYVEDPGNADPAYARARWRRLAPALAELGLGSARLARLATRLRRADDALERLTDAAVARCRLSWGAGEVALDLRLLLAEPEEIALRVLARAVVAGPPILDPGPDRAPPIRLDRLETCCSALLAGAREGARLRRTLGGRLFSLDRTGRLTITPEPPRARGRPATVTVPAVGAPHSLGIESERA